MNKSLIIAVSVLGLLATTTAKAAVVTYGSTGTLVNSGLADAGTAFLGAAWFDAVTFETSLTPQVATAPDGTVTTTYGFLTAGATVIRNGQLLRSEGQHQPAGSSVGLSFADKPSGPDLLSFNSTEAYVFLSRLTVEAPNFSLVLSGYPGAETRDLPIPDAGDIIGGSSSDVLRFYDVVFRDGGYVTVTSSYRVADLKFFINGEQVVTPLPPAALLLASSLAVVPLWRRIRRNG